MNDSFTSMRHSSVALLSLMVAGAACSDPIQPETAELAGIVAAIDASANRVGIATGQIHCITTPCFDYSVHVTGKVYEERTPGKYTLSSFDRIPLNGRVLVWTTGVEFRTLPAQVEAVRVLVQYPDDVVDRRTRR